ncbi:MAG: NAD-dependent protein deacetylase [Polyangiales bacterium]
MTYARTPSTSELTALARLFERGPVAVLTGAGVSTESGIPDYRGPETRRRARNPVQFQHFLSRPEARQRYWARSMLGWPRFRRAAPNAAHHTLRALEEAGRLSGLVTQNVDGLHADAGSTSAVELHGALREVRCLVCAARVPRAHLQEQLERANPAFLAETPALAPDGDADLEDPRIARFVVIDCACGGPLKPDVVFFGESVPAPRVEQAMQAVERAASLLVVGSSLAVYSGLRFVRAAVRQKIPVAIVSLGETRGDPSADLRIDAGAGATLTALRARLLGS